MEDIVNKLENNNTKFRVVGMLCYFCTLFTILLTERVCSLIIKNAQNKVDNLGINDNESLGSIILLCV